MATTRVWRGPTTCPVCGVQIVQKPNGRARVYCTDSCRKKASAMRSTGRPEAFELRIVTREVVEYREHPAEQCYEAAARSPFGLRVAVDRITELIESGAIQDPEWAPVRGALASLEKASSSVVDEPEPTRQRRVTKPW